MYFKAVHGRGRSFLLIGAVQQRPDSRRCRFKRAWRFPLTHCVPPMHSIPGVSVHGALAEQPHSMTEGVGTYSYERATAPQDPGSRNPELPGISC